MSKNIKYALSEDYDNNEQKKLDQKIRNDFIKHIESNKFEELKNDYKIWLSIYEISKDEKFDKMEQKKFSDEFGIDELNKLIDFFKYTNISEIHAFIKQKLKKLLKDIKPYKAHFSDELEIIENRILELFKN